MKLPDNTTIDFAARDTIRLLITRKYAPSGIGSLIQDAGFLKLTDYPGEKSRSGFGLDLVLLTKCGPAPDRLNGEARLNRVGRRGSRSVCGQTRVKAIGEGYVFSGYGHGVVRACRIFSLRECNTGSRLRCGPAGDRAEDRARTFLIVRSWPSKVGL